MGKKPLMSWKRLSEHHVHGRCSTSVRTLPLAHSTPSNNEVVDTPIISPVARCLRVVAIFNPTLKGSLKWVLLLVNLGDSPKRFHNLWLLVQGVCPKLRKIHVTIGKLHKFRLRWALIRTNGYQTKILCIAAQFPWLFPKQCKLLLCIFEVCFDQRISYSVGTVCIYHSVKATISCIYQTHEMCVFSVIILAFRCNEIHSKQMGFFSLPEKRRLVPLSPDRKLPAAGMK